MSSNPNLETAMNKAWFENIVTLHEHRLLRFLQKMVTAEVAREMVQESFLRLLKAGRTEVEHKATEWLFTVCRNLALDHLRKEGRVKPVSDNEDEKVSDEKPNPEAQLTQKQDASVIGKMLAKLSEHEQEVLRLKFQEDMSYQQISAITGHSISYVGVLIHTGLKKVRAMRVEMKALGGQHE